MADARAQGSGSRDPREIITPDAFSVAPELLGTPLARPIRRALAMVIDLVLIAILANAGGVFLGFAAAFLFFRIATRRPEGSTTPRTKRVLRATFGVLGAVVLVVSVAAAWDACFGDDSDDGGIAVVSDELGEVSFVDVASTIGHIIALGRAESETEARAAAEAIASTLQRRGVATAEIRSVLDSIAEGAEAWKMDIVRSAIAALDTAPPAPLVPLDSLALAYARALGSGDTVAAASLAQRLSSLLARDSLDLLQARIERLRRAETELEEQLKENERRGGSILRVIRVAADELGIGFGWSGLYFTIFLTIWSGRTPGKRLLRIRVVRLDGKPIGWWAAFNRFGGYAASIFTGLLGFFEMFWDANRQALHDRIANTVVVTESRRGAGGASVPSGGNGP